MKGLSSAWHIGLDAPRSITLAFKNLPRGGEPGLRDQRAGPTHRGDLAASALLRAATQRTDPSNPCFRSAHPPVPRPSTPIPQSVPYKARQLSDQRLLRSWAGPSKNLINKQETKRPLRFYYYQLSFLLSFYFFEKLQK